MKRLNIAVIGLGGIGSELCEKVAKFFNFQSDYLVRMILIDGDEYEMRNQERQTFSGIDNKAVVKYGDLIAQYQNLELSYHKTYVTPENIAELLHGVDVILLAVDNHKTRMVVSKFCSGLDNIVLISGGNELLDGNVQIYARKEGIDLTPRLTDYHPEIANPQDRLPTEMSCEELAEAEPQLYFVNLGVATIMCWALYNVIMQDSLKYSEVYFDMPTMKADSKVRAVPERKVKQSEVDGSRLHQEAHQL